MASKAEEKKDVVEEKPTEMISNAEVLTKYKTAAEIANRVAKLVAAGCIDGAAVLDLCKMGDAEIMKGTTSVYVKKVEGKLLEKGVAFPTCISVNNCICHNSPLESEEKMTIKTGDVVKIDLAVHIDGYVAPVATTIICGATKESPAEGPAANVVMAAHQAAEAIARLMQIGNKASQITQAINTVAIDFGCSAVEGMMSHNLMKNVIDGPKHICQAPTTELKKENKDFAFKENDVFGLDVLISSGDGKNRRGDQRTTVFKKSDAKYSLKQKSSRALITEVSTKFNTMPFTLRACELGEGQARMGLTECQTHNVLAPFDILWEKPGVFVAQFKMLVMVTANGAMRVSGGLFDPATVKTEKKLADADLLKAMATVSLSGKKKKTAAKKEEAPAAAAKA